MLKHGPQREEPLFGAQCCILRSQETDQPDLSQAPPFTLTDLKRAIPQHCWEKNTFKSVSYLVKDVAIVAGLAVAAYSANTW